MTPGDAVKVRHPHPRTKAVGWLNGHVLQLLHSGRVAVLLTIEGQHYRVTTDAHNVKAGVAMTAPRVHAVPASRLLRPGQCQWVWRWEGQVLRCEDDAIPGHPPLCPPHLIEHASRSQP